MGGVRQVRRVFVCFEPHRRPAAVAATLLGVIVALDLAMPRLVQHIIDQGIRASDRRVVVVTALAMLGIAALNTLAAVGNNVLSVRVAEGVARDLRAALFLKIRTLSLGDLDRRKTGQLLVRFTSDVNAIKVLTLISLRIGTQAPLLMLGSLVLMLRTSRELAGTVLPLLLGAGVLIVLFMRRMARLHRFVQAKLDAVNAVLHDNIAGARLVRALVRAEYETSRFAVADRELTRGTIDVMTFTSLATAALSLCVNAGLWVVIGLGGLQAIAGRLSIGQVVAFTNYVVSLMTPLILMTMLSNVWAAGWASARRINEVLEAEPNVRDAPDAVALPGAAKPTVAFQDVCFAYHGAGDTPVLQGVELQAEPGQTIGILGATGVGKSTLVNLIPRLYDPTRGKVCFAGQDVKGLTQESVLGLVGIVPQEPVLFSGSVSDNIRWGKRDASDDEVRRAAHAAQADEFISRMPGGYAARVEARGANLSGGQRQRLTIARALLRHPRVLILDDSTSAVDVVTEAKIHDAIASGRHERTTFIVAQRISTVLAADQIIVLDKGRVVARGKHRELLETSSVYREIYDSQLAFGSGDEGATGLAS